MKKVLVIGSSLNGAIHKYLNSDLCTDLRTMNVNLTVYSINGRAFLSNALSPPFQFMSDGEFDASSCSGAIKLLNTKTDMDGIVNWYGMNGVIDDGDSHLNLDEFDGIIINEILLWSLFPKTIESGYFVPEIVKNKDVIDQLVSAGNTPLSLSLYSTGLRQYKLYSFLLLDYIKKFNKEFPIYVVPFTMPRLNQISYNQLFRIVRLSEIGYLRQILSDEYCVTTNSPPECTIDEVYGTKANYTTGDIHHFNESFIQHCFNDVVFKTWVENL